MNEQNVRDDAELARAWHRRLAGIFLDAGVPAEIASYAASSAMQTAFGVLSRDYLIGDPWRAGEQPTNKENLHGTE